MLVLRAPSVDAYKGDNGHLEAVVFLYLHHRLKYPGSSRHATRAVRGKAVNKSAKQCRSVMKSFSSSGDSFAVYTPNVRFSFRQCYTSSKCYTYHCSSEKS